MTDAPTDSPVYVLIGGTGGIGAPLARRLAVIMHAMLRDGTLYQPRLPEPALAA